VHEKLILPHHKGGKTATFLGVIWSSLRYINHWLYINLYYNPKSHLAPGTEVYVVWCIELQDVKGLKIENIFWYLLEKQSEGGRGITDFKVQDSEESRLKGQQAYLQPLNKKAFRNNSTIFGLLLWRGHFLKGLSHQFEAG
jgi:hypothetical protein